MAEKPKMSFLNIGKDEFEIADEQARDDIDTMKLTKIWENPNPNSEFQGNINNPIIDNGLFKNYVVEYRYNTSHLGSTLIHAKLPEGQQVYGQFVVNHSTVDLPFPIVQRYGGMKVFQRGLSIANNPNEYPDKTIISFGDSLTYTSTLDENGAVTGSVETDDHYNVPIAIYRVGV